MPSPNFFIVGAAKCGTTSMYAYLDAHPQIHMSTIKEPMYFSKWHASFLSEEEYLDLWKDAGDAIRLGEASPHYFRDPGAAAAIQEFCPDAKIIIMLRNHADMAYSVYWHQRMKGREKAETFAKALQQQANDPESTHPNVPDYLGVTFSEHVERYINMFGRENVHVIIFDDFKSKTTEVYRETLRFLGVDEDFEPDFSPVNTRRQVRNAGMQKAMQSVGLSTNNLLRIRRLKVVRDISNSIPSPIRNGIFNSLYRLYYSDSKTPPLDDNLRRELEMVFRPDTERLGELIGRDMSFWYRHIEEA